MFLFYFFYIYFNFQDHNTARFSLDSILPNFDDYYRYSGSLTTPPCTEGVIWNVFTDHIPISANQVYKLYIKFSNQK